MILGSKSTDTVLSVFHIGFAELYRQCGLAQEVVYKTNGCEMQAKAQDMTKRVETLQISFQVKPGADHAQINSAMENSRIGGRVQMDNGSCTLTLPPFEWRQLPQLAAVDKIVCDFGARSLRSQSWEVQVPQYALHDLNINRYVEEMKAARASDLHLRAGARPYIRIDNDLQSLENEPVLTPTDLEHLVHQLGGEEQIAHLEKERETSFQFHAAGVGYLRVSGYFKDGAMALAVRLIPEDPMSFEELNIPLVVRDIANVHRGLFLVCGITGSGKSSTLAAMVEYINQTRYAHIITVEDPTEYVFKSKKSIISQRQVGRDTLSFANALRGALREDPDVIMVGEMRDMET
ncbi:MAG TPA: hypothetical protein ENN80_07195, partial [Candidatus Hydrogenedentes bacterium]|nr:hypothetical protein [Candidatus Hydrogenedentota bacterium]